MKKIQHYGRVYLKLIEMNFHSWATYRANFINSIVGSMSWGIFSVVSILLLTSRVQSVFGWTRYELYLLTGCYGIVIGVFHILFSRNFERLSRVIHQGQLDGILLKPMDSQFLVSSWNIGLGTALRVLFSFFFVLYVLDKMKMTVSPVSILNFLILLVVSVTLLYSIWFFLCTSMIWFTRLSNLVDFLFTITGMSRYPPEMTRGLKYNVFIFILPIVLIVATPTKALINRTLGGDVYLLIGFTVFFFVLSRWFWKFALRYYTSASG